MNAQMAQPVTATKFVKHVDANGTLTAADKCITNIDLTKALLTP